MGEVAGVGESARSGFARVLRIPGYLERLKTKAINPTPDMRVERRSGAIAVLEADRAPGAVAMAMAMEEAIATAREVHVGWCAPATSPTRAPSAISRCRPRTRGWSASLCRRRRR